MPRSNQPRYGTGHGTPHWHVTLTRGQGDPFAYQRGVAHLISHARFDNLEDATRTAHAIRDNLLRAHGYTHSHDIANGTILRLSKVVVSVNQYGDRIPYTSAVRDLQTHPCTLKHKGA